MSSENVLTFDVEEWHDRNDVQVPTEYSERAHVNDNVLRLLDLLDRHEARATFFCLGYIARDYPLMLREIHDRGHEVGCHHLVHNLLYGYGPEAFRREVREAKETIEDAIGDPVLGFRAPSWSIDERNMWVLDVLREEGFAYDSSIFPVKNHLYGVSGADVFAHTRKERFMEVPPTVFELSRRVRIPFATGFFFRLMPRRLVVHLVDRINRRDRPVVVALHPWEVFPDFERPPLPPHKSVIPYLNLDSCAPKLEGLLERFRFGAVRDVVLPG
jgi:polysaccharide deacetylase family protein (PEP-CTERM system associated)